MLKLKKRLKEGKFTQLLTEMDMPDEQKKQLLKSYRIAKITLAVLAGYLGFLLGYAVKYRLGCL